MGGLVRQHILPGLVVHLISPHAATTKILQLEEERPRLEILGQTLHMTGTVNCDASHSENNTKTLLLMSSSCTIYMNDIFVLRGVDSFYIEY